MWLEKIETFFCVLVFTVALQCNPISSFECGVQQTQINEVIVRGQHTSPGDWPWHTAVYHRNGGSTSYACGGTLISRMFVLTAFHCVKSENGYAMSPMKVFVRLGVHNLYKLNPTTFQQHDVHSIHQYDLPSNLKNDIALLKLDSLVQFNDFVQPAYVNQLEDLSRSFGTAVGWGVDESDQLSPILKRTTMPVVSALECMESNDGVFRLALDSSVFCAGFANGTTVCNGDSGGGLHFERSGVWYVGGIVAFTAPRGSGNLCDTESFAAFTNVFNFVPWIRNLTHLSYLKEAVPEPTIATPNSNVNLLPTDCGQSLINRISRGSNAKVFDYPWMVLVWHKHQESGELLAICGGSIISQRYVLTAATCLKPKSSWKLDHVILGEHTKSTKIDCNVYRGSDGEEIERDCADPARKYDIESYVVHLDFNKPRFSNNIGLIRLTAEIIWEYHIRPICLPLTPKLRVKLVKQYIVTGWGSNENASTTDILQEAVLPRVSNSDCIRKFAKFNIKLALSEKQMCAGGENLVEPCAGDTGSPLGFTTDYNGLRFVQFGMVSFGLNNMCGAMENDDCIPTIFTRVSSYVDWILDNVKP